MQHRRERLNDLLRGFLGQELRTLRDPRLELVTVTGVETSADYRFAKVYWSTAVQRSESGEVALPSEEHIREVQSALHGAEGLLKKRIAAELELRYTPALQFHYDMSGRTGSRIDELLKKAGF